MSNSSFFLRNHGASPLDVSQPAFWDAYAERLKFFCEANGITDDAKKRATLFAVCGLPTLTIPKSLISPRSLSDVSYEDIVNVLKSHFIPKPSVIYQRFTFQRCLQQEGEGVAAYVADLRHLADDCNFGSNLSERLRDQLVCGLKDEELERRLLACAELDLNGAIREAIAAESASSQARDICSANGSHTETAVAQQIRKGRNVRPSKDAEQRTVAAFTRNPCAGCGGDHPRSQSKSIRSFPVSSARKNATNKKVSANTFRHNVSDSPTDAYQEGSILFVTSNRQKKTSTTVIINNVPCRMEIDSGSDFTVISKENYRSLWKSTGPPIEPCRLRLVDFQRQVVPLAGVCTIDVSYGRHKGRLRLYVAKGHKATVAEPLRKLLRANTKWEWTHVHDEAFKKVKQLLSRERFLVGFNESLPITFTRDASQYSIGSVLAHDMGKRGEAPIAFFSRTMTPTERNYAQIDREALAIVSSVKKLHD
ncbi:hypothetical protein TTRE_0000934301 [Trichuris trichiura]|uniref:Reverse transcriptase/retrotransposon-derived protein RNase H-like domain-containing protein n=1 Tax=Trichuris trichiura TaxID=36087 RepID=A0A077ZKP6_TRITR|nr:hypothetical protein TTRE_0000934301 [Trichuris trichiura]